MNNDDEIERLIAGIEGKLCQALKAAIEQTRAEIDIAALEAAIASDDRQAIGKTLGIAANQLSTNAADRIRAPFHEFFESVGIAAATTLGYPAFTMDKPALVVRDILLYQVTNSLPEFNFPQ